jgi:chromosome segregation ATPase
MNEGQRLEQNIGTWRNDIRQFQSQIQSHELAIRNYQNQINSLRASNNNKRTEIRDLQSKINVLEAEIEVLQGQIDDLNTQIAIIERETDNVNELNADDEDALAQYTSYFSYLNSSQASVQKDAIQTNKTSYQMLLSENKALKEEQDDILNKLTRGDQKTNLLEPYHMRTQSLETILFYVYFIVLLIYAYFFLSITQQEGLGLRILVIISLAVFPFIIYYIETLFVRVLHYVWSFITFVPYEQ